MNRSRSRLQSRIADLRSLTAVCANDEWNTGGMERGRRFEHLLVLRKIDRTITSTMELRPILDVLLDQIAAHLHVDAATILLLLYLPVR